MSNIWDFEEVQSKYNAARKALVRAKTRFNRFDPFNIQHAKALDNVCGDLKDAAESMNFWAHYVADFESVIELQTIADYLHTIMPDVWSGVKIDYYPDKDFWQCGGRLMGRSTAKSAVQTMKEYCHSKGIELPPKE